MFYESCINLGLYNHKGNKKYAMRFGHESSNLILCYLIQLHVTGFSFHVNKFKIVIDEELKVRYGINFRNNLVLILTRLILRDSIEKKNKRT